MAFFFPENTRRLVYIVSRPVHILGQILSILLWLLENVVKRFQPRERKPTAVLPTSFSWNENRTWHEISGQLHNKLTSTATCIPESYQCGLQNRLLSIAPEEYYSMEFIHL